MSVVSLCRRDLPDSPALSLFPEVPTPAMSQKCHLPSLCPFFPFLLLPAPPTSFSSFSLPSFLWISWTSFNHQLKCLCLCEASLLLPLCCYCPWYTSDSTLWWSPKGISALICLFKLLAGRHLVLILYLWTNTTLGSRRHLVSFSRIN